LLDRREVELNVAIPSRRPLMPSKHVLHDLFNGRLTLKASLVIKVSTIVFLRSDISVEIDKDV
jgi:hypothetical protein